MNDDGLRNAFTHPENLSPRIASLSGPEHVTEAKKDCLECKRLAAENRHYRELLRAMKEAA